MRISHKPHSGTNSPANAARGGALRRRPPTLSHLGPSGQSSHLGPCGQSSITSTPKEGSGRRGEGGSTDALSEASNMRSNAGRRLSAENTGLSPAHHQGRRRSSVEGHDGGRRGSSIEKLEGGGGRRGSVLSHGPSPSHHGGNSRRGALAVQAQLHELVDR